jgi:hypothetical protein
MSKPQNTKGKCLKCNTIIESKHRHDYVTCACGACFVDGGSDYMRIGYDDIKNFGVWDSKKKDFIPLSIKLSKPKETV